MRSLLFTFSILYLLLVGCNQSPRESALHGAWKVDSTIKFYNGFIHREFKGDDWANYIYRENGEVLEARQPYFRKYMFEIEGSDKLIYTLKNGRKSNEYIIIQLGSDQMILKQFREPIFSGKGEERYETRYFSRADSNVILRNLTEELPNQ